ncbi:MAG TPA: DUF6538 domain-containing protein [Kaistia sp.]|nr:DUF6538 domain-containing protein [Kaistia sp.]
MPRRLKQRGGIWYYSRQVPARFADVDPRGWVAISLETRDLSRAERLKASVERELEAYWVSLKRGNSDDDKERYRGAIDRARLEGFDYRSTDDVARSSLEDILARLQRLEELGALRADGVAPAKRSAADMLAVEAVLGGVDMPALRLSTALDEFYKLTRDRVRAKSDDQLRKWKAPRLKAIKNLIALVGDKAIVDIARSDALVLRAWWQDRVIDEDYDPDTANKDFGHLAQVLDTLNDALELGLSKPFANLRLEADEKTTKVPFTTEELQTIALPATLAGMNEEAVAIVHTMIETGMRPSEICGLEADDIVLDADVPHVRIRPKAKRKLKTVYSEREIPLIGVSLLALQRFPAGFPAYRDRTSQLSALVNKVMRGRGLLPTDRHSLYSIRHSFQDRLTAVDMGDRMQAELMGHKFSRPEYGLGPTLKHKLEWLTRIAVTSVEDEALQRPGKA